MTVFEEILQARNISQKDIAAYSPLWKLKVTDLEFEKLKADLYEKANLGHSKNRFKFYKEDCMLYYSLFWQRIFQGGIPSKEDVVNSLGPNIPKEVSHLFYVAAQEAFEYKKMPVFQETYNMWFRCMLYQGGLPLNAICGEEENAWKRFGRRLVKGEINLDNPDLDLGTTAENYTPLRQFAEAIYTGIISCDTSQMPFRCEDINNIWFQRLEELRREENKKERDKNPFTLDQVILLDEVYKNFYPAFQVEAPKILPKYKDKETVELRVDINGILKYQQPYINGFNRNALIKGFRIDNPNDVICLSLDDELIDEKEFELSEPSFFYLNGIRKGNPFFKRTNSFRPGVRKIGIIPKNWEVADVELQPQTYNWNGSEIRILEIPAERKEKIILKETLEDNIIVFGKDNPSYDSVISYRPVNTDFVISPVLFNSENDKKGFVFIDDENKVKDFGEILYSKDKNSWSTIPPFGKIYAKVNMASGQSVSIKTLFNVGNGLKIEVTGSDMKRCFINIKWDKGQVTCMEEGTKLLDYFDSWEIYKDKLLSPDKIRFLLTPIDGNPFQISLMAPFRQISIIDGLGNEISRNDYIPFTDFDLYRYTIFGQDKTRLKIGNDNYSLFNSSNDGLRKKEGDVLISTIPYSGSLARLVGSRDEISMKFDQQGTDIINTQLNVELGDNNEIYLLHIKENPYILKYNPKTFILTLHNPDAITSKRKFQHRLYVLKLNEPKEEPIILTYEEGGEEVILPEELREIPNLLIIGKTPGRIIPKLINRPKQLANDNHTNSPTPAKQETPQEMRKRMRDHYGEIFDKNYLDSEVWEKTVDWFFTCVEYGLPYTTLIQLEAIPEKSTRLIKFLFSCLFSERIDKDTFINNLQQMARDCSFKWLWLLPYLKMNLLIEVIESSYNMQELPEGITFDILFIKTQELHHLISQLIDDSINESSVTIYNEFIERTKKLYEPSSVNDYQPHYREREFLNLGSIKIYTDDNSEFAEVMDNLTVNEKWVESRAKYFAQYLLNPIENDIFGISLEAKKSLRLLYKQAPMIFLKRTFIQLQKLSK